ncbi:9821_t:CDS:1, partial [Diversispora eburnea]
LYREMQRKCKSRENETPEQSKRRHTCDRESKIRKKANETEEQCRQ